MQRLNNANEGIILTMAIIPQSVATTIVPTMILPVSQLVSRYTQSSSSSDGGRSDRVHSDNEG
eukprot:scaffold438408_cov17-Prasinocladus_malaysianus.AAC.1